MIRVLVSAIVGFGSGAVISGAVFAFIAVIGIVQRIAQKTGTVRQIMLYEEAIIVGGVFGTLTMIFDFNLRAGNIVAVILSFCIGVFFGVLAISLAEVLNVIPILSRRANIYKTIQLLILSIAIGKLLGSLLFFIIPGFFNPNNS